MELKKSVLWAVIPEFPVKNHKKTTQETTQKTTQKIPFFPLAKFSLKSDNVSMMENSEKTDNSLKSEKFFTNSFVVWGGALVCCLLWGSAFPSIKIGYSLFQIESTQIASQILFAGIRFFLAGILTVIIGSITRGKILIPKKVSWGKVLKLSSFQTIGQYFFFYIGLAFTTGVRGSIVEGTNVFVAIFIASLIFHQENLTRRKLLGTLIGFSGVVLINLSGNSLGGEGLLWLGDLLVFASTFCYAISSVLLKRYSVAEDPVVMSGYQFIIGGFIMTVAGLLGGGKLPVVTAQGIALLVYLGFVSAVAYSLWGILLKYNPVSKVAVFGFMNPVFGVILSAIFLKEGSVLGFVSILSLVLTATGIFIVNQQKGER